MMRIPPWEFWPYPLVYSGIFAYYSTQAIRYGHPAWFSAVNPGIPYGGLYGYSKAQVLKMLPREYVPPFVVLPGGSSVDDTLLKAHDLKFPLIVKPDVGERGIGVEKVKSLTELQEILQEAKHPQIVQHCICLLEHFSLIY